MMPITDASSLITSVHSFVTVKKRNVSFINIRRSGRGVKVLENICEGIYFYFFRLPFKF